MLLFSTHMMLEKMTGIDGMALDAEECAKLAQALKAVGDHYHFETTQETLLWVNLVGAAAVIYGPRGVMLYKHMTTKRHPAPLRSPAPSPVQTAHEAANSAATPAPDLKPQKLDPDVYQHASAPG